MVEMTKRRVLKSASISPLVAGSNALITENVEATNSNQTLRSNEVSEDEANISIINNGTKKEKIKLIIGENGEMLSGEITLNGGKEPRLKDVDQTYAHFSVPSAERIDQEIPIIAMAENDRLDRVIARGDRSGISEDLIISVYVTVSGKLKISRCWK